MEEGILSTEMLQHLLQDECYTFDIYILFHLTFRLIPRICTFSNF